MWDALKPVRESLPELLDGALKTLQLTAVGSVIALAVGVIFGLILAFRVPVAWRIARVYVELVRGTPLLVQIFILFFGVPAITHLVIPAFTAGVIVIGAHHGAYFSEIVRGAIKAVPNAQTESAKAMGMSWWTSLREVLAPQALLHALPASGNQLIITVKDTSLLAVIGVAEVTHEGQIIIANTFRAFETWMTVAAIYLVLTGALALCIRLAERKLGTFLPENTRS